MIGCYDFCGHYEWTFEWLREHGGESLVLAFWDEAIGHDSQLHAAELIKAKGLQGMAEYWAHTLAEEEAGYVSNLGQDVFRLDIHDCPSKGFLLHNGLEQYRDYCDHCIGWIGPMMRDAGFHVHHEHNHCGQCWWEFRRRENPSSPSSASGPSDVRTLPGWASGPRDVFRFASGPRDKQKDSHD